MTDYVMIKTFFNEDDAWRWAVYESTKYLDATILVEEINNAWRASVSWSEMDEAS